MKVKYPTNKDTMVWVGNDLHINLSKYWKEGLTGWIIIDYSDQFKTIGAFREWAQHLPDWAKVVDE